MLLVVDIILEVVGISAFFTYIIVKGMSEKHRYVYSIVLLLLLSLFVIMQQTSLRYIPIILYYIFLIFLLKK